MAIKNIAVYQGEQFIVQPIGVDAENVFIPNSSAGDVLYMGNQSNPINTITISTDSITLDSSNLYTDVVISCISGDKCIVVPEDNNLVKVEYISTNTFRISGIGSESGETTIKVYSPETSNYQMSSDTIDVEYEAVPPLPVADDVLENNSWETIAAISEAGIASTYWDVGDKKSIVLNGTVGTLSLSNQTVYLYILGFDHNSQYESTGISFGGFKTSDGTDICLIDSYYSNYQSYDGTKYFQMNHWGSSSSPYNTNYGGWAACDMRYDILGSTDVAPSPYGSTKTTSATGSNPSSTCTSNPVANTLMAALPSDLRNVMKKTTKYTDNVGNSSNVVANVTITQDYLPLLAEYQVHGARTYANQNEQYKQAQYTYFINGNSKIRYKYNDTGSAARWWCRSADSSHAGNFCAVHTSGTAGSYTSRDSRGVCVALVV